MRSLLYASARLFLAMLCVGLAAGWPAAPTQATDTRLSEGVVVTDFKISPDSQYVVYKARLPAGSTQELYRVAITGGGPVKISVPISDSFQISSYQISPDSRWVVYTAPVPLPPQNRTDLYSVPITGTATDSTRLNPDSVSSGGVGVFRLTNERVVYRANQDAATDYELYSVPIDGSAPPVKLNRTLPIGGDVHDNFQIAPDRLRVVYTASQDSSSVIELYSVPIAGPASQGIKLNPPLVMNGNVNHQFLPAFWLSPDGSRVVYVADQEVDNVFELFSVPSSAGASVRISGASEAGGNSSLQGYQVIPDSSRVIYMATQDGTARVDLYSVPIGGPAASGVRLNDPTADTNSVSTMFMMGGRVLFGTGAGPWKVYSTLPTGPASSIVTLATGVQFYQVSSALSNLVYYKDGIFSVPIQGPSSSTIQIANLPLAGYLGYRLSPDGSRVAYLGTPSGTNELFSVGITQPYSQSIKISGVITAGGTVEYYGGFAFTPDGTRVVYRASQDSPTMTELYVTDGGYLLTNKLYLPVMRK